MNTQSDRYHWFVLLDGQRRGPLTYDDLTRAAQEGLIFADTPVWRSGWKNWHPARKVKGLIVDHAPDQPEFHRPDERQAHERLNEAPLAPDDIEWADEQVHEQARAPAEEVVPYAPPHHREGRRSQDPGPRWEQQPDQDDPDPIFADEWRDILAEQGPVPDRARPAPAKAPPKNVQLPARIARKTVPLPEDDLDDRGDIDYRPRNETFDPRPARGFGSFVKRAAIGMSAVVLMAGGGWVLVQSKAMKVPASWLKPTAFMSSSDLPAAVAGLPAVVALQRNDPAAFERFKTRFAKTAKNAGADEEMTLARHALRKSVKHLLAISPGDVLLETTEASLGYLQNLQTTNPESCVWLSDETKGARPTSNLAKELPIQFMREMSVLERIASTNPHMAIAPMTDEDAQPYFEKVLASLRRQNVRTDLQARPQLDRSEFAPYCALVIAFYQAVLELPRDDKVNVLRNLYAKAAVDADSDLAPAKK